MLFEEAEIGGGIDIRLQRLHVGHAVAVEIDVVLVVGRFLQPLDRNLEDAGDELQLLLPICGIKIPAAA